LARASTSRTTFASPLLVPAGSAVLAGCATATAVAGTDPGCRAEGATLTERAPDGGAVIPKEGLGPAADPATIVMGAIVAGVVRSRTRLLALA